MNSQTKDQLKETLRMMPPKERKKLMREAEEVRRLAMKRMQKSSRSADDEELQARRMPSVEDYALRILDSMREQRASELDLGSEVGSGHVIWTGLGRCTVESGGERVLCLIPPEADEVFGCTVAVGDVVSYRQHGTDLRVSSIHPRRSELSRPDPDGTNRLTAAANVDLVFITAAAADPPFHPRIVDRYLAAIWRGRSNAALLITKMDLIEGDDWALTELELNLEPYRRLDMPIILSSARSGSIEEVRREIAGKTCAFVGHSGVGKSSMLNALCPDLQIKEGEVSTGYGRGTHTTTASSLFDLGGGTRLIDTPGVRSFGLWDIDAEDLRECFPEFAEHSVGCRYRDCSHTHEPKCGVKSAVDSGEIHPERYEAYVRLLEEIS